MRSAVCPPPQAEGRKCLALHCLSGLARTEPNFVPKSPGSQAAASEHSLAVGALGTNPHGSNVRGEDDSWDLHTGAGFYSNATEDPWKTNCRMFSYVTEERPQLAGANFPVDWQRRSILVTLCKATKNPGKYISVSAFAPVGHPGLCHWGKSMRCDLSRVLFGFPV